MRRVGDGNRKAVPGATLDDLDMRRLVNYFRDIRRRDCPDPQSRAGGEHLLVNTDLITEDRGRVMPSVGGLLLFGTRPKKYLPQAGISAVAYPGAQKDYAARARQVLVGSLVSLFSAAQTAAYPYLPATFSEASQAVEAGVIEQALDFVRRNIEITAWIARTHPKNVATWGASTTWGECSWRDQWSSQRPCPLSF